MTKPDILHILGWDRELITAFEGASAMSDVLDITDLDAEIEPAQAAASGLILKIDAPPLTTEWIAK